MRAHLGDSSFTQKGRYKKCIGEDFPQTLAYGSHPKHFIVGGSTLWNVDIRSEEASPLFPYPDNISHKTSSWRRVNTRMGLESNSFSFWKSFTAVERHPQRPYLLAAASAATNTLYVLDSRSTFEPLMQIPLPSSRLGCYVLVGVHNCTFSIFALVFSTFFVALSVLLHAQLGSRFRSLLWHHAGLSDTENNEDALCAFTWKYHSLRCANFQLNEATWWTLPGYKDDFSAAVTPCFVDSLFGTSALGANSALTGAADALTVSSDQPSKNADSLVCVDDEKNSLLSTTGADTQYFPVSSSSVGTATLPSSNHPHCPRETNNDIPLELSRVDIHPVVEFPIGKWSTASDHRYYRPIGPLIEGPKELWGLAFRLCDDSSIAKIFHGMASAVCLRLPVFLMNAVENSPTVPDDSSSTGISPLSQSECKSGKIIKAVLSMAIGSTVSDYHLRHCNTVSSSIPLPSILSSHQNNIAPAVPLASVPLTGGNHFGSILQQGGEIAEDTTHCQDFDHSAIGHAGDRYKKDCPEEIARILRMYANKIRVPVLKRFQESKDDFDERLSIPSGNVTQRSSLQTVNAPNYFDFSFSLLHRRVRCYEIYPAQSWKISAACSAFKSA
ncbi:hypothetical protein IE077_004301 [Cardiosporidium cionae]|uniref:Uncharacterized protein n=1 Tax=Cardiosporidium cionae TaxID=476202 RepID=A0ABQ7JCC8_9APIC|nr:hypothetical protein IE077_004301 [Cardiosporidium cionae]|eukprot:KAF8821672.1 hypothetical protein IE077_004301 [Cardiosporidium cionae]